MKGENIGWEVVYQSIGLAMNHQCRDLISIVARRNILSRLQEGTAAAAYQLRAVMQLAAYLLIPYL